MGRYNGTFKHRRLQEPQIDPATGFYKEPAQQSEWEDGCECQIDKSFPAQQKIGSDGQMTTYNYDVFIPKHFKGELVFGCEVLLVAENGEETVITVKGVDSLNRKYTEIWG